MTGVGIDEEKKYDKHVRVRSFLINNLDVILDNISARRERKKHDTEDIFGMLDDESSSTAIHWKKNHTPKSNLELLMIEKESLGVYMSGNPLDDFEHILDTVRLATGLGSNLHLAIVEKIKKIFTKSQSMMFALQLTLPDTQIEGVIFSKKAMEYSQILAEKQLYWIIGRVDEKKSKTKDILSLSESSIELSENEGVIETVDSETDTSMEIVDDRPPSEFVEKPKLLISHIAKFDDGLSEFLKTSESPAPDSYLEAIPATDWTAVKNNPKTGFNWSQQSINNLQRQIPTSGFLRPQRTYPARKNFSKNRSTDVDQSNTDPSQPIYDVPASPVTASGPVNIYLRQDLGLDRLKFVKNQLQTTPISGSLAVYLWIQKAGEYKRAKGEYWIQKSMLEQISDLLKI